MYPIKINAITRSDMAVDNLKLLRKQHIIKARISQVNSDLIKLNHVLRNTDHSYL